MSAGVQLSDTLMAINLGINESNQIAVDLNYIEEREVLSNLTLGYLVNRNQIAFIHSDKLKLQIGQLDLLINQCQESI